MPDWLTAASAAGAAVIALGALLLELDKRSARRWGGVDERIGTVEGLTRSHHEESIRMLGELDRRIAILEDRALRYRGTDVRAERWIG